MDVGELEHLVKQLNTYVHKFADVYPPRNERKLNYFNSYLSSALRGAANAVSNLRLAYKLVLLADEEFFIFSKEDGSLTRANIDQVMKIIRDSMDDVDDLILSANVKKRKTRKRQPESEEDDEDA